MRIMKINIKFITLILSMFAFTILATAGHAASSSKGIKLAYGSYRVYGQFEEGIFNGVRAVFSMVTTRNPDMSILVLGGVGTEAQQIKTIESGHMKCGPMPNKGQMDLLYQWSLRYQALPNDPAWTMANQSESEKDLTDIIRNHSTQIIEWMQAGRDLPFYACAGVHSKSEVH